MSLADALDRAAEALPDLADAIRPANGDATRLAEILDVGQARALLGWILTEAPDDVAELADEWAEQATGLEAILSLEEGALPKPGRKLLRRVRHRLRSRGVEVPEVPAAPRVATLPEVEEEVAGAFVSPLDPTGSRVIVMVESHPGGGARIFELVVDEARGVRRCDVYQTTRGKARRFLREATADGAGAGVPVAPAAARALVARSAAAQPTDRSLPRSFSEWRGQLTAVPEGTTTPGAQAAAALGDPGAEDRTRLLALIEDTAVGPWPPPEESLRPTIEALSEARDAKIVVSGGRRKERFEEILADAAEAAYTEAFSAQTAARFEESAYVFWKTGREDEARACLAGAKAFREEEARSNPVARALLGRLLAPLMQEKEQEESESLLVKP